MTNKVNKTNEDVELNNNSAKENEHEKSFLDKNKWVLPSLVIVSSVIILLFLTLFAFNFWGSGLSNEITNWGAFGDFFAATFAPFINIIAAILVYKSFKAQIKANQDQSNALKDEIERSNYYRLSDFVMHDIESFENHIKSLLVSNNISQDEFLDDNFYNLGKVQGIDNSNNLITLNDYIRQNSSFNQIVALCNRYDVLLASIRELPKYMIVEKRVLRMKLREVSKLFLIEPLKIFVKKCKDYGGVNNLDKDNLENFKQIEKIISYFSSSEFKD